MAEEESPAAMCVDATRAERKCRKRLPRLMLQENWNVHKEGAQQPPGGAPADGCKSTHRNARSKYAKLDIKCPVARP